MNQDRLLTEEAIINALRDLTASIVAGEIFQELESDCPHYPPNNEKKLYKSVPKACCDECLQALKSKYGIGG